MPHLSNGEFQESEELSPSTKTSLLWTAKTTDVLRKRITHRYGRRQPPTRLPVAKQAEVSEMLADMQRRGVIEESDSPWSSPVVLVRKKNGGTPLLRRLQKTDEVTKTPGDPLRIGTRG
jgi:hypothetical protein